jgi:aminomethyltransferase
MTIKKTALYERHVALGAHMVEFKNTWLPVRFKSEIEEHAGVRNSVGIFDVSHMGEFFVEGPHAQGFLQRLLTNNIERLNVGNAHYSLMLNDNGGIIDDLIVYRLDEERYLLCVNAGNIDRDWHHVREQALRYEPCTITNASNDYAQLALQGPKSAALLSKLCYDALPSRFDIKTMNIAGITALVARTGYCGTDGFEIFVSHMNATSLFDHLCTAGKSDLTLCGLAARDSLRLEAGLLLHGQDMDETTSPKDAGLLFAVDMNKEYFVGKDMLERSAMLNANSWAFA